jgi:hypothetical protein
MPSRKEEITDQKKLSRKNKKKEKGQRKKKMKRKKGQQAGNGHVMVLLSFLWVQYREDSSHGIKCFI